MNGTEGAMRSLCEERSRVGRRKTTGSSGGRPVVTWPHSGRRPHPAVCRHPVTVARRLANPGTGNDQESRQSTLLFLPARRDTVRWQP